MDGKDLNTKSHQKKAGVAVLMSAVACLRAASSPEKRRIPQEDRTSTACGLNNRVPTTRMRQKWMHHAGKQKTHFLS